MHRAILLASLTLLAACGGGGGGGAGSSASPPPLVSSDLANRGLFIVAGSEVGLRVITPLAGDALATDNLADPSTEPNGTVSEDAVVAENQVTITEEHVDRDADGHNDLYRFTLVGTDPSLSQLRGSFRNTRTPTLVEIVPATAYRLPLPNAAGVDFVAHPTWEDDAGHRYTLAQPVAPHANVGTISSARAGFGSGTWSRFYTLDNYSWVFLRGTFNDGAAKEFYFGGAGTAADGLTMTGVRSEGPAGAQVVTQNTTLVAVPSGGG